MSSRSNLFVETAPTRSVRRTSKLKVRPFEQWRKDTATFIRTINDERKRPDTVDTTEIQQEADFNVSDVQNKPNAP